jgi:hypothetical protein
MDGEGEDARAPVQYRGRVVVLVDVRVDHGHLGYEPLGPRDAGGYDRVVQDAEALSAGGEGVVGAACEVRGEAFFEGGAAGTDGAARGAAGALDLPLGPGEADPADLLPRERAGYDLFEVIGVVGALYLLVRDGVGETKLTGGANPRALDRLAEHRVLFHREAVSVRQWEDELVRVEDLHACYPSPRSCFMGAI